MDEAEESSDFIFCLAPISGEVGQFIGRNVAPLERIDQSSRDTFTEIEHEAKIMAT